MSATVSKAEATIEPHAAGEGYSEPAAMDSSAAAPQTSMAPAATEHSSAGPTGMTSGTTGTGAAAAAPMAAGSTAQTNGTETAATDASTASHHMSGILGYKAPGLISKLRYSKRYFWTGDEAVKPSNLRSYIDGEKATDVAHHNTAWASQTGKGLLYFVKREEDKKTPSGILNLADITEVDKGPSPTEFSFKINGKEHGFQAKNQAERDEWHSAVESSMYNVKGHKEDIVSGQGYKDTKSELAKGGVAALGAGAVGGTAAAVAARKKDDSSDEEEKKEEKEEKKEEKREAREVKKEEKEKSSHDSKSRSQSRKRQSLFSAFGSKKEEDPEKRAVEDRKEQEKQAEKEKKEHDKLIAAAQKEQDKKAEAARKEQEKKDKAAKEQLDKENESKAAAQKKHHEEELAAAAGAVGVGGTAAAVAHHDEKKNEVAGSDEPLADKTNTTRSSPTDADGKKAKRSSGLFGLFNRDKSPSPASTKKEEKKEEKLEKKEEKKEEKMEKKEQKQEIKEEKKEQKAEKKEIKAEQKEEKKEIEAENKAEKKEIKAENKAEKKEMKAENKEEKKEMKAEKKEEKKEMKEEKKEMKEEKKEEKKGHSSDAAPIAAGVAGVGAAGVGAAALDHHEKSTERSAHAPTDSAVPVAATGEASRGVPASQTMGTTATSTEPMTAAPFGGASTTDSATTGAHGATDAAVLSGPADLHQIANEATTSDKKHEVTTDATKAPTEKRRLSNFGLFKSKDKSATDGAAVPAAGSTAATSSEQNEPTAATGTTTGTAGTTGSTGTKATTGTTGTATAPVEEKKPSTFDKLFRRSSKAPKPTSSSPAPGKAATSTTDTPNEVPPPSTTTEATKQPGMSGLDGTTEQTGMSKMESGVPATTQDETTGANAGSIGDVVPEAVNRGEPATGTGPSGPAPAHATAL